MQCKNLYEAIDGADYIIGPIPCSHNGGTFNAPFHNSPVYVDDALRLIKPNQVFIAGYMKPEIFELAAKYNIRVIDMLKREELLISNAIPTVLRILPSITALFHA
jgi:dipicolinate synthase subunit A